MRGCEKGLYTPGMLFLDTCPIGTYRGKAGDDRGRGKQETIFPFHPLKDYTSSGYAHTHPDLQGKSILC